MTAKQLSVFIENKPGQVAEFTRLLHQNHINMHALSMADAQDFGVLRTIVDDSYKAACVLKEAGYIFSITPVLAVEIPDQPGSLVHILDLLDQNDINLEYTYAFTSRRRDRAYMIVRVADTEKACEVLNKSGVRLICQSELSDLFAD
ncbi:acetolactate synthase [Solibaculum mannosilyticum]|uniref:Amino acid-binding protein n=1 Tax=Solibaculum mannosilyticum TaxID=2780922 RepID=A0A7I8CZ33_9FIRM|nr:acetolactate synthase [Solibaculum mannosilyticum]BCI59738.1 amino acid-binding protein [Solibaculum mannosilyticum]